MQLCCCASFCNRIARLQLFIHQSSQKPHFPVPRSCRTPFPGQTNTSSPASACPRACLGLRLSAGSGAAGDLRPSSRGCRRGWTQTLSSVWLGSLRGGGSGVGDDSLSIHSSTIKPISSGRIRGCAVLIRPPHPIGALEKFDERHSRCHCRVCACARFLFHCSFFVPKCLFIDLSNLFLPSSVIVFLYSSVIVITAL